MNDRHEPDYCVHLLSFTVKPEIQSYMIFHTYGIYKSREKAIEALAVVDRKYPFAKLESHIEGVILECEVSLFEWDSDVNEYIEIDFPGKITGELMSDTNIQME